jgi:hypothetical protein
MKVTFDIPDDEALRSLNLLILKKDCGNFCPDCDAGDHMLAQLAIAIIEEGRKHEREGHAHSPEAHH